MWKIRDLFFICWELNAVFCKCHYYQCVKLCEAYCQCPVEQKSIFCTNKSHWHLADWQTDARRAQYFATTVAILKGCCKKERCSGLLRIWADQGRTRLSFKFRLRFLRTIWVIPRPAGGKLFVKNTSFKGKRYYNIISGWFRVFLW